VDFEARGVVLQRYELSSESPQIPFSEIAKKQYPKLEKVGHKYKTKVQNIDISQ